MSTDKDKEASTEADVVMRAYEATPLSLVNRLRALNERARAEMNGPELPISIEEAIRAGREQHDPSLR